MPAFLQRLNISLVVSTYQAQRIMTLSPNGDKLFMWMRSFERPTGLNLRSGQMVLCTKNQIWFFEQAGELRDLQGNTLPYDITFIPRRSHVTGDIAAHEIFWKGEELTILNTRFSCFCTLSPQWSFVPGWKPRFITDVVPEDRCHLNGVASDLTGARYVSALGETNTKEGWRQNRANGGILIDYDSGEVVSRGMSMPHSPRLHQGKLWILESGLGELQYVDISSGARTTVARLPGYLRGLAFHDRFAFVGLCKIREKKDFGGLPIETMYPELECGIHIVDITTGQSCGFIRFTKGIEELFDIRVLSGFTRPHILGFEEETINGVYIIP